jgi:hypothetical protein
VDPGVSTTARRRRGSVAGVGWLLVLASIVAACGGGAESETTTTGSADGTGGGENLALSEPKETIEEARDRIAETLASGECKKINELNPVSRPSLSSSQRCTYLGRLDGLEVAGAEAYGDAGAVIEYENGERTYSAVLIRDSDGLFHLAFLNPFGAPEVVGTKYAKEFDETAERILKALEERDCKGYAEVAFLRFGRGRQEQKALCEFVEKNPIGNQLEVHPDAEYESAGGNGEYGFYTLATPATTWTLVFARQVDRKGQPPKLDLPKDAATYAYVDAYLTGVRKRPEE